MNIIKSKAQWLPPRSKFITQIFISIRALLTLPFFKETPNGIKKFFSTNYNEKKDEFVFDGSSENSYYNQITNNCPIEEFKDQTIIDLGCGNGSFYFWLKNNNISIKQYCGIDFAFENTVLTDSATIKNISINDYLEDIAHENVIYIMSNSLCYIPDVIFQTILSTMKINDKIIIIEPYPNLFWDSHFDGIKPYYRKPKGVITLLENSGLQIYSCSVDYIFEIKNIYLSPISYSIFATKK